MLDNLQILFQILSAALKVGINSSILQMRKLRLREAKKVAQVHGRKLQNQNLYREQPEGVFYVFISHASFPQRKALNTVNCQHSSR